MKKKSNKARDKKILTWREKVSIRESESEIDQRQVGGLKCQVKWHQMCRFLDGECKTRRSILTVRRLTRLIFLPGRFQRPWNLSLGMTIRMTQDVPLPRSLGLTMENTRRVWTSSKDNNVEHETVETWEQCQRLQVSQAPSTHQCQRSKTQR
jgi:hypothetical protein